MKKERLKYKYKIQSMTNVDLEVIAQILTDLSKKGWELITVQEERYYFKKEKK